MSDRIGFYAWGGPGTIRLLRRKYHSPKIDESSFLHLYDQPYLFRLKKTLPVTDMWVTYSWGFSDSTEQPDYEFITQRLASGYSHIYWGSSIFY